MYFETFNYKHIINIDLIIYSITNMYFRIIALIYNIVFPIRIKAAQNI